MKKPLVRLFCLAAGVMLVSQLTTQVPGLTAFNQSWIDSHTRNNGLTGVLDFILVSMFLLSMGLPRQLIAFMGGYAFGIAQGIIYSTLAATLSCAVLLYVSRYLARPIVTRHFATRVCYVDKFLQNDPLIKSVIIRLLPVGNNVLTNIIAGISNVKALPFIGGSVIGYIPQMATFALMGKGVLVNSEIKIMISILLLGVSGALGAYLLKRYRYQPADTVCNDNAPINNGKH